MKNYSLLRKTFCLTLAVIGLSSLSSCLNDDDNTYEKMIPNALVTAKTDGDDTFFLQLDEQTTLLPVNMASSPFGEKEVRALVNYEEVEESSGKYSKAVQINWIDSILTKPIAPDLGEDNDSVYGNDPIEILNDWVTIAEDGYLTLRFMTNWGYGSQPHYVNLLRTDNAANPYEVEFRHNAYGDVYGELGSALVAFDLSQLSDTDGKTVKLTLKWKSFSGEKSTEFDYCTQKATNAGAEALVNTRTRTALK